jgi:hypothetical protein
MHLSCHFPKPPLSHPESFEFQWWRRGAYIGEPILFSSLKDDFSGWPSLDPRTPNPGQSWSGLRALCGPLSSQKTRSGAPHLRMWAPGGQWSVKTGRVMSYETHSICRFHWGLKSAVMENSAWCCWAWDFDLRCWIGFPHLGQKESVHLTLWLTQQGHNLSWGQYGTWLHEEGRLFWGLS